MNEFTLLFNQPKKKKRKKVDPLSPLRDQLTAESKDFRSRLPEMQNQRAGLLASQAQDSFQTGLETVQQNFNDRGLLYSGMRQGAETGLRGQISNQLRSSIAQSNKELQDQALSREQSVASIGLQHFGSMLEKQSQLDQLAMQNQVARAQAFGGLAQAAGYAAGNYMQRSPTPTYASQNYTMPEVGSQFSSTPYGLGGNYNFGSRKLGILR